MTHIEQMIQDMCPNGVEFKTLGEVCKTSMGEFVKKDKQNPNAPYPVYNGGSTNTGFYDDYNTEANKVIISARGAAGFVNKVEVPFWAGNSCHVIDVIDNKLNWRFLYYYLKNHEYELIANQQKGGGVPAVSKKQIEAIEIPLPPLEIQKKIVECLDKFSALAAELQAELQARRKQYEYYRTQLLTPHSDCNSADNTDDCNWEWKTLGEIGKVCMCKRILKNQTHNSSGIPFYKIGSFGGNADAYIDEETYLEYKHKYSYPNKGDILISAAGTIGKSVIFDGAPSYFQDSNIVWIANNESTVLNKYLYYYYQIVDWKVDDGGVIKRLYNDNLKATKIAFPPLAEQARIVSILDKFEALTTSLSDGIPAEQAAQQKRYEYYRDLLLTFPRKAE